MLSYTPNLEDVLLRRCFRDIEAGFYVDIGAHHPTHASVTRSFYDAGWSGINVEPGAEIAALRVERTRDVNIEAAVADFEGESVFWVHDSCTATSSLTEAVVPRVAEVAGDVIPKTVKVTTLNSIIERHAAGRNIHFLKIDAEGAEDAIVRAADWKRHRPEVIVIESTEPFTTIRRNEAWQDILQKHNFTFAYFDGVNDFWVRNESTHLLEHFKVPINVLDGYQLYNWELDSLRQRYGQQASDLAASRAKIAELSSAKFDVKRPFRLLKSALRQLRNVIQRT
jgi:FkbM family methyltransferase